MRTKEDLRSGFAAMLHDLRIRQNLSKAKMARRIGIDDHTWNSWESGKTAPSIIDFIQIFESCGESMMRPVLEMLYPDHYSSDGHEIREQLIHFIQTVSTDHQTDVLAYMAFGNHGSNYAPQVEMFCAYNHIPMEQRFIIAEMVYTTFLTAKNRGDLLMEDSIMPDMETWENGLKQAQRAAYKRLQLYTTITEEGE